MSDTPALFLAFVAALALVLVLLAAWRFGARTAIGIAIGLALWLGYVGILSRSGLIADPTLRPPAILYVVGPVFLFVMFGVVRSKSAGRRALAVPLWTLIGLQTYRIGVELFLHQLWADGLVPKMLTFEGANVDLWIGATAPVAAWLSTRGRGGERIAAVWTVAGLLSLANVIVRSAMTAPGPLNLIHAEVANRAIGTFPYTFIAGFFAPLAVILHVLALRSLAARHATPSVPKGLPVTARVRLASLGAASLALSGCVVGPAYERPNLIQSAAFRAVPRAPANDPARAAPALDRWWTGFDDPALTKLVALALAQNLDVAQAEARVTQARAQAKAAGAALLPAGQLNAQAAYSHQSLEGPPGRIESAFPGFDRDQSLYDLNAGASWEPDLFGGLRRGAQAARAEYQASEAARAGATLSVAAETADSYVLVRALQARLAVAEDQSRTQHRLLDLTELQFSRGIAARLDVDRARGALSQVDAAIPVLRAGLESALNALEILVGLESGSLHAELSAARTIPRPPTVDAGGGPASLLRRRPDIVAAERRLAASDARIGVALADYYPKITLSGVLGFEAGNVSHLIGSAGFQPQGLIGLRWRLFDFGRVDAEVAAARGARAEALAAYRLSVLKATGDVENALTALAERERQARTLDEGEAALARARAAAAAAYGVGRVSLIEVLDADARLLSVRDARVQAQAEAARAAIGSFKALGGGWTS